MTWRNCSGKRRNPNPNHVIGVPTQALSPDSHQTMSSCAKRGPTLLKLVILSEAKDLCSCVCERHRSLPECRLGILTFGRAHPRSRLHFHRSRCPSEVVRTLPTLSSRAQRCERSEQRGAEEPALSEAEGPCVLLPLQRRPRQRRTSVDRVPHNAVTVSQHRLGETLIKSRFPPCTPVYPVVYAFCRH